MLGLELLEVLDRIDMGIEALVVIATVGLIFSVVRFHIGDKRRY